MVIRNNCFDPSPRCVLATIYPGRSMLSCTLITNKIFAFLVFLSPIQYRHHSYHINIISLDNSLVGCSGTIPWLDSRPRTGPHCPFVHDIVSTRSHISLVLGIRRLNPQAPVPLTRNVPRPWTLTTAKHSASVFLDHEGAWVERIDALRREAGGVSHPIACACCFHTGCPKQLYHVP